MRVTLQSTIKCSKRKIKRGVLPPGLLSLETSFWFNREIEVGTLPISLTELTFGFHFDQTIKNNQILPPNLIKLTFGVNYKHPLFVPYLPKSLKELHGCKVIFHV